MMGLGNALTEEFIVEKESFTDVLARYKMPSIAHAAYRLDHRRGAGCRWPLRSEGSGRAVVHSDDAGYLQCHLQRHRCARHPPAG